MLRPLVWQFLPTVVLALSEHLRAVVYEVNLVLLDLLSFHLLATSKHLSSCALLRQELRLSLRNFIQLREGPL